jgi:hypothetical protein
MREGALAPFGADGGVVEVDETYIGRDKTRTYLKTSKLAKEDANGRKLDEAEEVDGVILPTDL